MTVAALRDFAIANPSGPPAPLPILIGAIVVLVAFAIYLVLRKRR